MRNILSKREFSGDMPRARLEAIWHVEADQSYDVSRLRAALSYEHMTAVRTLTGRGSMELFDGARFELEANSLMLVPRRDIAHYAAAPEGWHFYWFEFIQACGPDELFLAPQGIPMSAQERIELERCFVSLGSGAPQECLLAESLFNYLLADWRTRARGDGEGRMSAHELIALLERGRQERLSIAGLARRAGMCERSFRDAVHAATGMSPKAYMLRGEMAAAMELLRTSGMSVAEIAACFEYSSPFYFSRVFKKYYGLSPQQVRDGMEL